MLAAGLFLSQFFSWSLLFLYLLRRRWVVGRLDGLWVEG